MINVVEDFENKIRKFHLLPEAVVIDYKTIGYPFYYMHLDLTYLSHRSLELQEEFVLKCLKHGLVVQNQISNFLGVDDYFVEKVLSGLLSKGLVIKHENLKVTELGLQALQTQALMDTVSETKPFYIDAFNGEIHDYFQYNKVKNKDIDYLTGVIRKPKKVEDVVDYYEEIEKKLGALDKQEQVQLIQVNNIEKVYKLWHEVDIVLYKNNSDDNEVGYEFFSKGNININYRKTIEELYSQGQKVLDNILSFEMNNDEPIAEIRQDNDEVIKGIKKDTIKTVERLSVKINSLNNNDSSTDATSQSINEERKALKRQLDEIKTQTKISEIIHTSEHRDYLFKAFKEAEDRVMIVSPWIRSNVIDNRFLEILEKTLRKKVQVYIFYGLKQKKGWGQQNDTYAIKKLEELANNFKSFRFEKVDNTHRKIVVCDKKFGIVTSFNFLSFKADPKKTYRDELGVILRDKKTIEDLFQSGLELAS